MRILSTISFVVLIGLICLTKPTLSDKCLEYVNILDGLETRAVDCPRVVSSIDKRQTPTSDNMFVIKFTCSINNQDLCNKVNNVYNTAGQFITATLNLKVPINVNAQLQDFCATQGLCNNQETILGAGKPSRLVPYQDPNDKLRFYPQALHKQLNLPDHPEYGPDDITAIFNSNVQYWFEGDQSLSVNQVDMLYVVIHELVHGLGFVPAWNDNLNIEALTPGLGISQNTGKFLEVIFDKYLVLYPSGQPLTAITDQLNQFKFDPSLPDDQIAQSFKSSPQYSIAHDLYIKAMTPSTMAFLTSTNIPPNTQLTLDDVLLLETSLSPFQPGSSIGHADLKTYLKSGDFLMMYTYPHATLGQMMSNAGTTNTTGPIGPKLRTLLGILGYEIKPNYVPPVQLSSFGDPNDVNNSPSPGGGSSSPFDPFNPFNNGSSSISFNLMLLLVCILLIFTIIELN